VKDTPPLSEPPRIEPVAPGAPRPTWSVMIPTYNSGKHLRQTLESVLVQALDEAEMQIEVVDDCSTLDDPEALVREVGKGRIAFHRRAQNGGHIANFNTCVARSRGHLVHILHGDDYLLPGFYERITAGTEARPDLAFFATRAFYINEEGVIDGITPRVPSLESGGTDVSAFFYETPTQFPGVVVRRSCYEHLGGFLPELPYLTDC
jgi:glycosyltransferase involved in cell wall biosynthesis